MIGLSVFPFTYQHGHKYEEIAKGTEQFSDNIVVGLSQQEICENILGEWTVKALHRLRQTYTRPYTMAVHTFLFRCNKYTNE